MEETKNAGFKPRKAAMYVRMSTDHQKYSTENQADKIREYASFHGIEIIKTFTDSGKSGLKIEGRDALREMITEVESGSAEYSSILVLDVTRWGRFQDADESAYYEYICKRAGVQVCYVAEQFDNDGSPVSTIVKGVKRAMAGEYSRELSSKVFAGQCRLIEPGYKQGGFAGYGLRRVLIDEHGNKKAVLSRGEHKSFQTDRVILAPGPEEEIEIVNWIYKSFVEEGLNEMQIAKSLNDRGIKTDLDRSWNRGTVNQVLTNEKYIGNSVFNKRSFKLKKQRVENPPEMWIRADGAFEAIVDPQLFYMAQGIIRERSRKYSDQELLDKLKSLHQKHGLLSGIIIDESDFTPSSSVYQTRFGSLLRAYELIGYTPDKDYSYIEINRNLREFHSEIVKDTIGKIDEYGGVLKHNSETGILHLNNELKMSIIICRCIRLPSGAFRWNLNFDTGLQPDITIAIRMDANNEKPVDYYILPTIDITQDKIRVKEDNDFTLDIYRFDSLEAFFLISEREYLSEVA
jgi:DNA invertase Pin-like site-specific DNA recombinase